MPQGDHLWELGERQEIWPLTSDIAELLNPPFAGSASGLIDPELLLEKVDQS
jgi:hypothetical protein